MPPFCIFKNIQRTDKRLSLNFYTGDFFNKTRIQCNLNNHNILCIFPKFSNHTLNFDDKTKPWVENTDGMVYKNLLSLWRGCSRLWHWNWLLGNCSRLQLHDLQPTEPHPVALQESRQPFKESWRTPVLPSKASPLFENKKDFSLGHTHRQKRKRGRRPSFQQRRKDTFSNAWHIWSLEDAFPSKKSRTLNANIQI